jgi:tRNA(Ile)-lysidine synthase
VLDRFTQFIENNSLCTRDSRILLAVSGGLDSMVMLDMFMRSGYRVGVAHVNFQLRGRESDRDQDFVKDYCSRNGIPFHTTNVDTNNYATEKKVSVQMAARSLRYEWFHKVLENEKYDVLATAHHLSDAVETVILNIVRGSGMPLKGIPVVNNRIIRPLMFATRDELSAFAASHSIAWREDESNISIDYQRNVVRHHVIPVLQQLNPGLEASVQRSMVKALGDDELVRIALNSWQKDYVHVNGDQVRIEKSGLKQLSHPESLLARLLEPFGFNYANVMDVLAALNGQPGKVLYSSSHALVIDRAQIIISPSVTAVAPVSIQPGESTSRFGSFELAIREENHRATNMDPHVAYLDKDKVNFPLQWRTWKDGDYFFPLGMKGRKKVSDFLVDLKISIPDKQSVTVIESQDDIVCIPGFRIDDRFKVTPQTRTALVIEIKPVTKMPPVMEAS